MLQDDLDRAMDELSTTSPEVLAMYAYACFKLLAQKRPSAVKNGSFGLYVSDVPIYSKVLEREIPVNLDIEFYVKELVSNDES